MRYPLWMALAFVALMTHPTLGEAGERAVDIQLDDYFGLATITNAVPSRDGKLAVYSEMRWDKALDRRNTDLWVVASDGSAPRRLTFDDATDRSPQFSADGDWIYFLSARKGEGSKLKPPRDGKTQVWRLPVSGGTPQPVTRRKGGVNAFQLVGADTLVYSASSSRKPDDPFATLRSRFSSLEYGTANGLQSHELIRVNLQTWRETSIASSERVLREFSVSPNGKWAAVLTTPDAQLVSNEGWSELDLIEVETEKWTRVDNTKWRKEAPSPYGWMEGLAWSSDSKMLATSIEFDGFPGEAFAVVLGGGTNPVEAIHRISRPDPVHLTTGHSLAWRPDSQELCMLVDVEAAVRMLCAGPISAEGAGRSKLVGPKAWKAHTLAFPTKGSSAWVVASGLDHPPDIFRVSAKGKAKRITRANPQVDTWKLPQVRKVQWKSKDGTSVEGILELPPSWKEGDGPLPFVVAIHGGPTSATQQAFRFWIYGRTLFAAKGYALLSPNYRGSKGYGDEFMVELIGRENEVEVDDILTGVDAMVDRGIADPKRMMVMGWSNGGFLTNAVLTHTDRFRAASSGAGIFDFAMQWATQDTPGHQINFQKGLPWEQEALYRDASPLFDAGKIRTPTLIHVGTKDARTPPPHSKGLFRALSRYNEVPTELVMYPGAGHGLSTYTHRHAKLSWDHAWFEHWLAQEDKDKE